MRAMLLDEPGKPLRADSVEMPRPGRDQVLIQVHACGVCRTDLHLRDGEVEAGHLPLILGHQIVGTTGDGRRVGVPWLGWADGVCEFCDRGLENLCPNARFTGRDIDGGYAEYAVADERFVLDLPEDMDDMAVAPLLCGGLIGYRALRLAGDGERLGLYGFGAAAHMICQVAVHEGRRVFAFTRPDDDDAQLLALKLGAEWAGDAMALGPEPLDAAIIFAPAGELVPAALRAAAPGGVIVCAGIHMSDIPSFPYELLWQERVLRSVANLTRADAHEFLELAPQIPVRTTVQEFALNEAEAALDCLRAGKIEGAAVLRVQPR
ncbi:MAG TPA: zinc-dependent alcohol dehydrogenase family protein [Solirubrobacteraceae bacterium]|nr:zinc-dependent alcohol dehydrogenase family protein [Solirubrobacteraceae bacterium]